VDVRITEKDLCEIRYDDVESVDVAQDGGQQRAVEDTLMNNGAP
jgi:hypothetical protein